MLEYVNDKSLMDEFCKSSQTEQESDIYITLAPTTQR